MPQGTHSVLCHVECLRAPASEFARAIRGVAFEQSSESWHHHATLRDGTTYVRWDTIGEFLVAPDGRRILCRRESASAESFQVYMLGQALSFALVKQGFEPLHATVVELNGRAVALLGGHAFGKSTLAACFLHAGFRLLTDDLLIVQSSSYDVLAYPGPPRIKLFPGMARRLLGRTDGVEMNADTGKLIVPVDGQSCRRPVPLQAIYSLAAPGQASRQQQVRIQPLSLREAFIELVGSAFNRRVAGPARLTRQFDIIGRLTDRVPVKTLIYPRALDRLPEVLEAVLDDLGQNPVARPARTGESGNLH